MMTLLKKTLKELRQYFGQQFNYVLSIFKADTSPLSYIFLCAGLWIEKNTNKTNQHEASLSLFALSVHLVEKQMLPFYIICQSHHVLAFSSVMSPNVLFH
jgi:hypothetical protein